MNGELLWYSVFIKTEIVFRNFVPRGLLPRGVFPLYSDLLANEIEGKPATQTCQAVNSLRPVCNFQSMKSPVEQNSLLSKLFCYITWFVISTD